MRAKRTQFQMFGSLGQICWFWKHNFQNAEF